MNKNVRVASAGRALIGVFAALLAQSTRAQEFIPGGAETFTLNVGGIANQFDTNVTLNGGTQQGTPVNLEGNGLKKGLSSLEVSGTWRIGERNRIDALYFGAKRSGSRQLDRDITIGDKVIPAGYALNAEEKDQYLLVDYRYSFIKNDAYEVGGALGFYGGRFEFDFVGTGAGTGGAQTSISNSSSTTVPLPVIGVTGDWYVQPRWKVSTALMGMAARIGDVDGNVTIFQLGTDFMFTRNFGIGLSYLYTKLNVDVSKSGFNGNIDWKNNAVLLYATMKF